MEILKKVSHYIKGLLDPMNRKKLIENCAIVIVIGIILMIAGGSLGGSDPKESLQKENPQQAITSTIPSVPSKALEDLEGKLEEILMKIEGAGKVHVMITYVASKEVIPAYDMKEDQSTTREKDSSGGSRESEDQMHESSIAYEEVQGEKKPVILKEIQPMVKGVLVVADGAGDPAVKEKISKAVQVLWDVPIHKVEVFEREK